MGKEQFETQNNYRHKNDDGEGKQPYLCSEDPADTVPMRIMFHTEQARPKQNLPFNKS